MEQVMTEARCPRCGGCWVFEYDDLPRCVNCGNRAVPPVDPEEAKKGQRVNKDFTEEAPVMLWAGVKEAKKPPFLPKSSPVPKRGRNAPPGRGRGRPRKPAEPAEPERPAEPEGLNDLKELPPLEEHPDLLEWAAEWECLEAEAVRLEEDLAELTSLIFRTRQRQSALVDRARALQKELYPDYTGYTPENWPIFQASPANLRFRGR